MYYSLLEKNIQENTNNILYNNITTTMCLRVSKTKYHDWLINSTLLLLNVFYTDVYKPAVWILTLLFILFIFLYRLEISLTKKLGDRYIFDLFKNLKPKNY